MEKQRANHTFKIEAHSELKANGEKLVLRDDLKTVKDCAHVIYARRLFHSVRPAMAKALSPLCFNHNLGIEIQLPEKN